MGDWFEEHMGWVIVAILVFGFSGLYFSTAAVEEQRQAFMKACVKDRPGHEYECVAMWRAGDRSSSSLILPIVIPSGR